MRQLKVIGFTSTLKVTFGTEVISKIISLTVKVRSFLFKAMSSKELLVRVKSMEKV